jgi:hypothetical protein
VRLALLFSAVGGSAGLVGGDFLSSNTDIEALRRRLLVWPQELRPVPWLSLVGADYYINLPEIDNWSMYGSLRTTWTRIGIKAIPRVGHTSVVLDLHDFKYSSSNGNMSSGENLSSLEWGIAADCRGNYTTSEMRINLTGTPFNFYPVYATAVGVDAHGQVVCSTGNQICHAACGGSCGSCGLGKAGTAHHAILHVIDQEAFDNALRALLQAALDVVHHQNSNSTSANESSLLANSTLGSVVQMVMKGDDSGSAGISPLVIMLILLSVAIAGGVGIFVGRMIRRRRAYGEFEDNPDPAPQTVGVEGPPQVSEIARASA